MNHRTILALGLLALGLLTPPPRAHAAPTPRADWQETVAPGEHYLFAAIAREINAMQDAAAQESGAPVDRAFHPKRHGVMRAEFRVAGDLPAELKVGAFKEQITYAAWVRLSNGKPGGAGDRAVDVRGLAMKLLQVPGNPLTPPGTSMDFLAINVPEQPARDIHQFMALVRAAANPWTLPVKLAAAVGVREATRMIAWTARRLSRQVTSLATENYWSGAPISFGRHAVKFHFKAKDATPAAVDVNDPDYLQHDLAARLKKRSVEWDLMAQLYVDPGQTPIEDASVEWMESASPPVKIGTLTIRPRDLESAAAKAEAAEGNKLLFHPWNVPQEHRPLGSLMRARRVVYPASGKHRGSTSPSTPERSE